MGTFGARRSLMVVLAFVLSMVGLVATSGAASADIETPPLEGRGHISGVVTDGDDTSPVQGVVTELYNQTANGSVGSFIGTLSTDETGRYAYTNRLPKCYYVRILAPEGRTIVEQPSADLPVCIEAGDVVTDLNAELDAVGPGSTGTLVGVVTELDDTPMVDVKVDLFLQADGGGRGDFVGFARTDETGAATFAEQPIDCYVLTYIAPEGRVFNDNVSPFIQRVLCIEEADQTVSATVALQPVDTSNFAQLGGLVSEADLTPVAGVAVELISGLEVVDTATTGDDGRYEFAEVMGGACYNVRVVAPLGRTIEGGEFKDLPICVEPGDSVLNLDAILDAEILVTVSGTVTDSDASGVVGVNVEYFASDEAGTVGELVTSTATIDDGVHETILEIGCYVARIEAPFGRTIGGEAFVDIAFCAETGDVIDNIDATLDAVVVELGSITGVVSEVVVETGDDLAADPVFDVKIDLFEANDDGSRGAFLGFTRTAEDGTYTFAELEARCYTLTFIAPEGRTFTNGSRWFQPTRCVEDGLTVVVDAELAPDPTLNGTLSGQVTNAEGAPVDDVKVDLFNAENGSRTSFVGFTRTDETGAYQFSVPAGCYIITMIAPEGDEFTTGPFFQLPMNCVEANGAITGLDGALLSGANLGSVGGSVLDSFESPVADVRVTYWSTRADGGRGDFLGREDSDVEGLFSKALPGGCYWLVGVAPEGSIFESGQFAEAFACIEAGESFEDIFFFLTPLPE